MSTSEPLRCEKQDKGLLGMMTYLFLQLQPRRFRAKRSGRYRNVEGPGRRLTSQVVSGVPAAVGSVE